jgi:hypothetical protein
MTLAVAARPLLELMERMLRLYEVRLLNLADQLDPDAIEQSLDANMQALWHLMAGQAQRHRWLRSALQLPALPAPALLPPAHRLVLLERPQLLRVLAARAVFGRHQALRHCIDRQVLDALRLALGSNTLQALQQYDGEPVCGIHQALQKDDIGLPSLVWQGYAGFMQDGMWRDETICPLIRLALPVHAGTHEQEHAPALAGSAARNDSTLFMAGLPTLFPELTCLFG